MAENEIRGKEDSNVFFSSLVSFLRDLFSPDSKLLGKAEEGHDRVFIMITRRGYWLYRVARDARMFKNITGLIIRSDRYLTRLLDASFLSSKEVILFDDTLTDGKRMFEFYTLLTGIAEKERPYRVIPAVFNLSMNYNARNMRNVKSKYDIYLSVLKIETPTDEIWVDFLKKLTKFNENLKYYRRIDTEISADFSLEQTKVFQKNLAPLVMNLPMLRRTEAPSSRMKKKVLLTAEQFRILTSGNREWAFSEISYDAEKVPVTFGFFQLLDEELIDGCSGMIHDLTVKCKYNRLPDGKYEAVFVPFAVIRSMTMSDVHHVFCVLFRDTDYYKYVQKAFINRMDSIWHGINPDADMSKQPDSVVFEVLSADRMLCCAEYRSIIFSISDYVSCRFKEYVKETIGIALADDMRIMEENFEKAFVSTVEKKHKEYAAGREDYKRIYRSTLRDFGNVVRVGTTVFDRKQGGAVYETLGRPTAKKADQIIRSVIDRHRQMRNGTEYNISFEEIEYALGESFRFESKREFRHMLTSLVLKYLEISVIGNDVSSSEDTGIIRHDFRPGENADVYCRKDILYMYAYFYGAYAGCPDERMENRAGYLLDKMEAYFNRKDYFGFLIDRDDFLYYKKYLLNHEKDGDLRKCVQNKSYLLDDYFSSDMDKRDSYIDEGIRNAIAWIGE